MAVRRIITNRAKKSIRNLYWRSTRKSIQRNQEIKSLVDAMVELVDVTPLSPSSESRGVLGVWKNKGYTIFESTHCFVRYWLKQLINECVDKCLRKYLKENTEMLNESNSKQEKEQMLVDLYNYLSHEPKPQDSFEKMNFSQEKDVFTDSYTLLRIDISKIRSDMKFYSDPRADNAVYSLENIPPSAIECI